MIAVCGRGKSLGRYLRNIKWSKLYLVNNFDDEIYRLGLTKDSAFEIIHVAGRKGATVLTPENYEKLNIRRIVSNSMTANLIDNIKRYRGRKPEIRPEYMNHRGYPGSNWEEILRGKVKEKHKENGHCWPTTGMFAIDLALRENHPNDIHLFGFDMYREQYLVKPNRPHQKPNNAKYLCMALYLNKLVNEYKGTTFYCYSNIEIEARNWVRK